MSALQRQVASSSWIDLENEQFLVDMGSDLRVYPRRLIPRHRERVNYDFCAVNGTAIHTYGRLPLSLNLCLRRDFTWRFLVADVTQPLIDVMWGASHSEASATQSALTTAATTPIG
jgi:hypothetical protein